MEQIKNIAKNLNRYFGVIKFIMIALTIFSTIVVFYILFNTIGLSSSIYSITLDWLSLEFNTPLFSNELHSKIYLILLLVSAYITIFIFFRLLVIVKNILNNFIDEKIFKDDLPNHLVDLSKLFFIYGVFTNIFSFIHYRYLISTSNLITILESNNMQVTTTFSFDINFIILSAVIYLLAYIFRYGAQLQQLSDETL